MAEEPQHEDGLENPEEVIDDITESLDQLHGKYSAVTIAFGEDKERIQALRGSWQGLAASDTTDPVKVHVYASGIHALQAYRDDLVQFKSFAIPLADQVLAASPSSDTTVALTNASIGFVRPTVIPGLPSALLEPRRQDNAAVTRYLEFVDPALARTYTAVREVLYGTRSDPERAALYLLRQTFDHFFAALSPDEQVRHSRFFKEKSPPKEDQVYRHERLMYAAHTHIADPLRRTSIIASFSHMLNIYDALSAAHERGDLDQSQAMAALTEMLTLLQDWVRAIEAPQSA